MQNFLWLAFFPVVLFAIGIAVAIILNERQPTPPWAPPRRWQPPPDGRSLLQRWEYAGSMDLPAELRHRAAYDGRPDAALLAAAAEEAERLRWARLAPLEPTHWSKPPLTAEVVSSDPYAAWGPPAGPSVMLADVPDTGEWETMHIPAWTGELTALPADPASTSFMVTACPDCEARDDQPHADTCRLYTPFIP